MYIYIYVYTHNTHMCVCVYIYIYVCIYIYIYILYISFVCPAFPALSIAAVWGSEPGTRGQTSCGKGV